MGSLLWARAAQRSARPDTARHPPPSPPGAPHPDLHFPKHTPIALVHNRSTRLDREIWQFGKRLALVLTVAKPKYALKYVPRYGCGIHPSAAWLYRDKRVW